MKFFFLVTFLFSGLLIHSNEIIAKKIVNLKFVQKDNKLFDIFLIDESGNVGNGHFEEYYGEKLMKDSYGDMRSLLVPSIIDHTVHQYHDKANHHHILKMTKAKRSMKTYYIWSFATLGASIALLIPGAVLLGFSSIGYSQYFTAGLILAGPFAGLVFLLSLMCFIFSFVDTGIYYKNKKKILRDINSIKQDDTDKVSAIKTNILSIKFN
jgi:hypothetical protein